MRLKFGLSALAISAGAAVLTGCGGSNSSLSSATAPAPYGSNMAAPQTQGIIQALQVLKPSLTTAKVDHNVASAAIWVNKKDATKSLVFATDNDASDGGVVAMNLSGKAVDKIKGLKGAYGVDVQYNYALGKDKVDLLVVSEPKAHQLRVFKIVDGDHPLVDITGKTNVFDKSEAFEAEPTALGVFRRFDGNFFAIVSRAKGPKENYLGEYKLTNDGTKVSTKFVRFFGNFSGEGDNKDGTVNTIAVDSSKDRVVYGDLHMGYREYRADPDAKDADHELGLFSQQGYQGVRGALAVGKDYLVGIEIGTDGSTLHFYPRDAKVARTESALMKSEAVNPTGIAISSKAMGKKYPEGIMVATNAKDKTLQIYDWKQVTKSLEAAKLAQATQPQQQYVNQGVPMQGQAVAPGAAAPGAAPIAPGQPLQPGSLPPMGASPGTGTGVGTAPGTGTGTGTSGTGTGSGTTG